MRRNAFTGLILAPLLAVLWSSGASAHPGATVFTIQVGAPTSISIVVPADYGRVIDEVDITDAPGFTLTAGEPPAGWTVARQGSMLVFSGGQITLASEFAVFAIRGVAAAKGRLVFPVTTHSPDGTVMRYDGPVGTPNQGAVVYAGVTPHAPPRSGFPWIALFGKLALGVGVIGTAYLTWWRRRAPVGRA